MKYPIPLSIGVKKIASYRASVALLISSALLSTYASATPVISEFMASNDSVLTDGNGATPDWIEIYNPGVASIDLVGYRLTDDREDPAKWVFPTKDLPGGEYLVVFASGDATPDSAGNLHTNFKLSAGGEYLALYSPTGTLLSEFGVGGTNYPPQATDVSYGIGFEMPPLSIIGNDFSGGNATAGNGSFEDTDPSTNPSGSGNPTRWAVNAAGQVATVDGWSAIWQQGFLGFDDAAGGASHGNNYAFLNHNARGIFRSADRAEVFIEGDVLDLSFDATTNAADGMVNFSVSLRFGSGGDRNFAAYDYVTPTADFYQTQTFQHVVTAAQAGANTIAVEIIANNATGGPADQPRFDNVFLTSARPPATLIDSGDTVRFLIPGNASVDATWMMPGFDDSGWATGATPLGFENSADPAAGYNPILATDVPVGTTSTYLRQTFIVDDVSIINDLTFSAQYDDGFIVYLNGIRVEGENDPISPAFDSVAQDDHQDSEAINFIPFSLNNDLNLLQNGVNVIAVHALNRLGSSDYLITPKLDVGFRQRSDALPRDPQVVGVLLSPTPGAPNTEVRAGDVLFSAPGGLFTTAFDLTLSPEIPGETVRYTLDGSVPNDTSLLYTAAIPISTTTEVRARAFSDVGGAGNTAGNNYVQMESSLSTFSSNLPVIVLDNDGAGNPLDKVFRTCFTAVFEPDPSTGRTSLTSAPTVAERSAWHRRGSSSFTLGKPNYRLEIRDQNDDDKNVQLLGMPSESDWILLTFARFDRAMIRNPMSRTISELAGQYAPRLRYVEVFFNQDGDALEESDYFGVYALGENIKRDNGRIDITAIEPDDNSGDALTGGYVFKSDRTASGDFIFTTDRGFPSGIPTPGGVRFVSVEPDGPDITNAQRNYLSGYVQECEDAIFGPGFQHPITGAHYSELIDIDSFVDQHIFQIFNKGPDALRFSTFFHKDRGEKLRSGPIWDQERIFGVETDTSINRARNPENWNGEGSVSDLFDYDWYGRLFEDPDYMQRWIDRWQELRGSAYSSTVLEATIDGFESQLLGTNASDSPVTRNFIRWGASSSNNNNEAWPNARIRTSNNSASNGFYQFASPAITAGVTDPAISPTPSNILAYWRSEMDHVRNWIDMRIEWIYTELSEIPGFSLPPGEVAAGTGISIVPPSSMSGAGQIFYTTDGTDPRAPGGSPATGAIAWNGTPISIQSSQLLTARILDPGVANPKDQVLGLPNSYDVWSAPVTALFQVGTRVADALVLSEINYNPHPPTGIEMAAIPGVDNDDFEFLELLNTHPTDDINLAGAAFTDGISFTFSNLILTPGERVLAVRNLDAFEERYGTGLNVAEGVWSGGLKNDGERLTLSDAAGVEIFSVDYSNGGLWDSAADGQGRTLVLADPAGTPRDQIRKSYRWVGSASFGGSPNGVDAGGTPPPGIVINEVLAHTDLPQKDSIELHNPTGNTVNISGWYLSDSGSNPLKFQIPGGTVLAPGAYIVFDEEDFNPTPSNPGPADFALNSSEGDDVYLVIPTAGNTGVMTFVDHISFGATFNGNSLGRFPDGSGRPTLLQSLTLGAENADPLFGPVIISEVNYNPGPPSAAALAAAPDIASNDLEFIEIYNAGAVTVDLTDWRLRGEGDFDFSSGTELGTGQVLTVIAFDPDSAANTGRLAAFRAHYGIGAAVPLVGGLSGKLNDSEGRVELERPDDPPSDNPSLVPHVTEDELIYDDLPSWPLVADGTGDSLHRGNPIWFGRTPLTWYGLPPTPGTAVFAPVNPGIGASLSLNSGADEATLQWPSQPGALYNIKTSLDLIIWEDLETALSSGGSDTDYVTPAISPRKFFTVRETP